MMKVLSNGKSQKYHFIVNEDLSISLFSKLITYFIDGFTLGKNPNESFTY